jgi:hypothetical protein
MPRFKIRGTPSPRPGMAQAQKRVGACSECAAGRPAAWTTDLLRRRARAAGGPRYQHILSFTQSHAYTGHSIICAIVRLAIQPLGT